MSAPASVGPVAPTPRVGAASSAASPRLAADAAFGRLLEQAHGQKHENEGHENEGHEHEGAPAAADRLGVRDAHAADGASAARTQARPDLAASLLAQRSVQSAPPPKHGPAAPETSAQARPPHPSGAERLRAARDDTHATADSTARTGDAAESPAAGSATSLSNASDTEGPAREERHSDALSGNAGQGPDAAAGAAAPATSPATNSDTATSAAAAAASADAQPGVRSGAPATRTGPADPALAGTMASLAPAAASTGLFIADAATGAAGGEASGEAGAAGPAAGRAGGLTAAAGRQACTDAQGLDLAAGTGPFAAAFASAGPQAMAHGATFGNGGAAAGRTAEEAASLGITAPDLQNSPAGLPSTGASVPLPVPGLPSPLMQGLASPATAPGGDAGVWQAALATRPQEAAFGGDLASEVRLMMDNGSQRAELRLNPADLGPIGITLRLHDQTADIAFTAAHAATREGIERALPALRDMLSAQGLGLGQAGVQAQAQGDGGQARRDAQGTALRAGGQSADGAGRTARSDGASIQSVTRPLRATRGMLDLYA